MSTLGRPAPARRALVPAAQRVQRPGWRDPRLLLGLALVSACVLLGARIMASADDTVAVWSVREDLSAGTVLDRDDLQLSQVRFTDGRALERYVGEGDLPEGGVALTRDLAAGELLPVAALGGSGEPLVEVPLAIARDDLPGTVGTGSVVDVWVARDEGGRPARLLLDDVRVLALPTPADSLAPETTRQVIVGVREETDGLGHVLGTLGDGRLVLTQRSTAVVAP